MKRRDEKQLDDYRDGVLPERERKRIEADPELSEQLNLNMGLGALVKDAWTEGPPAPAPEVLFSALRPAMARIDAEIEAASPWNRLREQVSEWFTPGPVAAMVGAAALLMLAVLPAGNSDIPPEALIGQAMAEYQPPPNRLISEVLHELDVQTVSTTSGYTSGTDKGSSVYDLGQGRDPLMLFESDDATVIWVIPDDSVSLRANRGGWV